METIESLAEQAKTELIPEASKENYAYYFSLFLGFIAEYDIDVLDVNNDVMLAFF